jgi:hypothetical protein
MKMNYLKEQYSEHDESARDMLKETFEFKNKRATVLIDDVNYWTFGELLEDIPEDYYKDDPGVMMNYQINKIKRHYEYYTDDCYQGYLMPWYGTGVLASGFGINIVKNYKADPAVDLSPVKKPEEIKKLKLPDPQRDGLMPQVLRTLRYFKENCDLPVGVTDCQGPLTTALSVVGYDNFSYWMYDYPKLIHELMADSFPLGLRVPDGFGGVWISDDDSVIIGAEHYREFVVPYNSRVLKAFGGGCIHFCGTATQHIENYLSTEGLTSVNNFNLDNIAAASKMREALRNKGIPYMACDFVPNDSRLEAYYNDLLRAMGGQKGLIIISYVAPAVELENGRYSQSHRDQFELGKRVKNVIDRQL